MQIYNNVNEVLVGQNLQYLKISTIPELEAELMTAKQLYRDLGYRIKLTQPPNKLQPYRNYIMP